MKARSTAGVRLRITRRRDDVRKQTAGTGSGEDEDVG